MCLEDIKKVKLTILRDFLSSRKFQPEKNLKGTSLGQK